MSTQQTVIETSFAKSSGYGNAVFSKTAHQRNVDHINELFGDSKQFDLSPMQCEVEMDFLDPQDSVASRDLLMQAS